MLYDDDGGTLNFAVGLVIGAAAGAALALLLAPYPGHRTRRKILRRAEDWGDVAGDKLEYAAEDLRRAAVEVRKAAERSGGKVKRAATRSGGRVRKSVEEGRERLNL